MSCETAKAAMPRSLCVQELASGLKHREVGKGQSPKHCEAVVKGASISSHEPPYLLQSFYVETELTL